MNDNKILNILELIYGREVAQKYQDKFQQKVNELAKYKTEGKKEFDQSDSIMITYGDSISDGDGKSKIETLTCFANKYLDSAINTIHILPCFPYTSDDGFSVVDYKKINSELGTWKDIEALNKHYNLMLDLVANHISRSSYWFQEYLKGNEKYKDYFITCDPSLDYSSVIRPRTLPLLTEVDTVDGKKSVWTTFSTDQIDLNYKNPEVLLEVIDVLIEYVSHGASIIRLDAIAFIWKEIGTSCLHLPQTHEIIKLIRVMVEKANVDVKIITETNVPHKENMSYFGNGSDEASMVYNFPLPPLTLYTFLKGDASVIKNWANDLTLPSEDVTFFNFLASHDGIGLNPAKGLIDDDEIVLLAKKVEEHGGYISHKNNFDGTKSPYEMNINYLDALKIAGEINVELEAQRFIASQSIILEFTGVPGIYVHSLIGSRNYTKGVEEKGTPRTINREKLSIKDIEEDLKDPKSIRSQVLSKYKELLLIRKDNKCFSPKAKQEVLMNLDSRIFGLKRFIANEEVICLTNISNSDVEVDYELDGYKEITNEQFDGKLTPYQVVWLKNE
jgi:sucrose phosphorylase